MANVSDLVSFALTVTTRYNYSNIIAKLSYFNKINGVAGQGPIIIVFCLEKKSEISQWEEPFFSKLT